MKRWISICSLLLVLLMGCSVPKQMAETLTESPGITETATPTVTNAPVPTETPTLTATATPTPTLAATPTPTPTPSPTPMPDLEAPIITLYGESTMEVIARSEFADPGFSAVDDREGDITELVQVSGEVDINWCGTYSLTYDVTDLAGNQAKAERTVIVKQPETIVPEGKIIYLTFDDGPGKYTNEILDILAKYNVTATFFTCGNGQPTQVTKIHEAGHTVGIHCKSHDYTLVYASEEAYFEDLFAMQDLIYECTGVRTTLVRFPGGSSNMSSSFNPGIMTRLTELLEQRGFQYFDWNVSSGDSGTKDTDKILSNMKKGVENRQWSVVLQHPETREFSMKAVEDFIVWALENGYTFLPLDNTSPGAHHSVNN